MYSPDRGCMTDDEEFEATVLRAEAEARALADRLYPGMRVHLRETPFVNDAGTETVMVPEGHEARFRGVERSDEKALWVFSTEGIPGLERCCLRLDDIREIIRWNLDVQKPSV